MSAAATSGGSGSHAASCAAISSFHRSDPAEVVVADGGVGPISEVGGRHGRGRSDRQPGLAAVVLRAPRGHEAGMPERIQDGDEQVVEVAGGLEVSGRPEAALEPEAEAVPFNIRETLCDLVAVWDEPLLRPGPCFVPREDLWPMLEAQRGGCGRAVDDDTGGGVPLGAHDLP